MMDELLKTFANHTRSLEILYLLNGLKKAVRLDSNESEIRKIADFCGKNGLFLEISDFKVVKEADVGKGGYANIVKKVPVSHPTAGLYHLYISKDKNKAKFLKLLESKNDDKAIGEILGYPECCIDFFIANKEKQQKIQNDFILPALKNSRGFKFPFYTNHAIRYFDMTLLSHFPHDFNCKESIKIAEKNLGCIKKHSGELASKFEHALKVPVLYTENQGIFIFENFKFSNSILEYGGIKSTANNELFKLLNKIKKIEVLDKNDIKTGDKILTDAGFMLFI